MDDTEDEEGLRRSATREEGGARERLQHMGMESGGVGN
jgi:hypothetical protein